LTRDVAVSAKTKTVGRTGAAATAEPTADSDPVEVAGSVTAPPDTEMAATDSLTSEPRRHESLNGRSDPLPGSGELAAVPDARELAAMPDGDPAGSNSREGGR
jgi:hypothetical protein